MRQHPRWRDVGRAHIALLGTSALRRAGATLRQLEHIERTLQTYAGPPAGLDGLRRLAGQLAELVALENAIEIRIGELLAGLDARPLRALGLTSVAHYAEERLHMNRTTARDRIDAARGLRRLPVVERTYEQGRIGLEKALLILRLSKSEPMDACRQEAWVQRAQQGTLKRCRDEYRAARRTHALRQSDPASLEAAPAILPAMLPLDDASWLASIRRVPGATRAFVLDVGCRTLDRQRSGRFTPLASKFLRLPADAALSLAASIDAARRGLLDQVTRLDSTTPAGEARLRPSVRIARLFAGTPVGVPAWVGLLGLLEEYVLVWDAPETMPDRHRDAIHQRDGYRCTAPGCTMRRSLEVHHLRYRSDGGSDVPSNLVTVCAFHHRLGEHGMLAACAGEAPLDVVWGLGHPELRTWYRNEMVRETVGRRPPARKRWSSRQAL
jgi:hypothetical protein